MGGTDPPTMEMDVHLFEMTGLVDSRGHYVLRKHTLATLSFKGIAEVRLLNFNNQNVILDLEIERAPDAENPAWTVDRANGALAPAARWNAL